jgi:hypothetical protein
MPDRDDCSNEDRGDRQSPALAPSLQLMRLPRRKCLLGVWGRPQGGRTAGGQQSSRLFIRKQRKNFAPCTEVKLKVSLRKAGEFMK